MPIEYSDFPSDINIELLYNSFSKLYQINGTNTTAGPLWIQVFNKNVAPVDTDIPEESYLVQASSNYSISFMGDLGKPGRLFDIGIGVAFSSTQDQLTNTLGGTLFAVWWKP